MPRLLSSLWVQMALSLTLGLAFIGAVAGYEWIRSREGDLRATELRTQIQAQVFAEYARSMIQRIDEALLDLRAHWTGDPAAFAVAVRPWQVHLEEIAFHFIVADAHGDLVFSNLAPTAGINVRDRDYFQFHQRVGVLDELFISQPVHGRISQRWALQFTRAIRDGDRFNGIIVISVNPDLFARFAATLKPGVGSAVAMVNDQGTILARYPDNERYLGRTLLNTPMGAPDAPLSGHFHRVAQLDSVERIYGFQKLPEYNLNFVIGAAMSEALATTVVHRVLVLKVAAGASVFTTLLIVLLFRSLRVRELVLAENRRIVAHQRLLSMAVAQSSAAVVMTDTKGTIVFVNEAFTCNTGYSLAEALGQNPRILQSGRTPRATYEELWTTICTGHTWQGELLNKKKNGELYWESATISPVADEQGRLTHFIALKENITSRKQYEERLRQAREQAETAAQVKSQFLSTMSHEIRTPMNGILGMAQLLLQSGLSETQQRDYARTLFNSGQTLMTLLNDLLDLSQIEAGQMELTRAVFDPARLIQETTLLFTEAAQRKSLRLESSWDGPPGQRYWADPIRLRQMLSNLLSNALKFTAEGTIRIEASEVERGADTVVLAFAVIDSGIGIPPEQQTQLFQPFTQLDSSTIRRFGGAGLGLSIVRGLAHQMGGEAGVDSAAEHGARFWIRIRAELARTGQDSRRVGRASDMGRQATHRILVVEDDPVNCLVIEAMLVKRGYAVSSVADGQAAIETLRVGDRPDLVLMDCQLPVMDGFAATEQIRQWEAAQRLSRLPIVALTASVFQEDRDRCLSVGMDDFLAKPVNFSALTTMLNQWLTVPTTGDRNAATTQPPVPVVIQPLDTAALIPQVRELADLLARNKFSALRQFKALQAQVAGTEVEAEISAIGVWVTELQFEEARARLRELANTRGWMTE